MFFFVVGFAVLFLFFFFFQKQNISFSHELFFFVYIISLFVVVEMYLDSKPK